MTHSNDDASVRYCGRIFTAADLAIIRHLITSDSTLTRAQLSRIVCDKLGWLRPDGRRKDMSCRVAMLRMHEDGLITLPPAATRASTVARTKSPGLRRPSALSAFTRTFTVRVRAVRTGSMKAIVPSNRSPG